MSSAISQAVGRFLDLAAMGVGGSSWYPRRLRPAIYRLFGMSIHESAEIGPQVRFLYRRNLKMGEGSYLGALCYVENHATVDIKPRAWVAAGTRFATPTHDIGDASQRAGRWKSAPITVGEGAWVGMGCTILGGVTIGEGVILAAGSVVTTDCAANSLYAGVPARLKRQL